MDTVESGVETAAVVEKKRRMLEVASGLDLSPVAKVVQELETYDGRTLLDQVQAVLLGLKDTAKLPKPAGVSTTCTSSGNKKAERHLGRIALVSFFMGA